MKQMNSLVSVMMPVYNGEKTIGLAIKSLLYQTYLNWQCIIVNDGSTDNTKEIIKEFDDDRITLIDLPKNMGRPYARQVALDNAQGEFLSMLDADDFYHPSKLEIQVDVMNKYPDVALVGAGMGSFGEEKGLLGIRGQGESCVMQNNGFHGTGITHAPSMLRLYLAKKHKYNQSLKLAQDVDYLSRYLDGQKFIVLREVLYYYSEFDSVSLGKIRKAYIFNMIKAVGSFRVNFKFSVYFLAINFLKFLYSIFVYPFIGIDKVLLKRGNMPSLSQLNEYSNIYLKISH